VLVVSIFALSSAAILPFLSFVGLGSYARVSKTRTA
jgi:hypothetical protein